MMERSIAVVCAVAGFLGIASAAMGFAAEATKIKGERTEDDVYDPIKKECSLPKKNAAVGLALASALTLLTAQIIINDFSACFCFKKHPSASWKRWAMAFIAFIFSWLAFITAILILLAGAYQTDNDHRLAFITAILILLAGAYLNNQQSDYFETCIVIKPGAFSGAAVSALAVVCLGLISYVSLNSKDANSLEHQNLVTASGQPQFPAPSIQQPHAPNV